MKKIYSWMLAAAFLGGSTLTMTSCHKDDKEDEPAPLEQPQEQKDERPMSEIVSKVMVEHIRNNVKGLAENYSNGALKTMVYGGYQMLTWTKFDKKYENLIAEYSLKKIKKEYFKAVVDGTDLKQEGYTKYFETKLTDLACSYEFSMEKPVITDAEKFTLIFPLDLDGMAEKCKVVLTDAGNTYEEEIINATEAFVAEGENSEEKYAVVIKTPKAYKFEVSLLSGGEYQLAFDGEVNFSRSEGKLTINSHLKGYSQYGIRDDENTLNFAYKTVKDETAKSKAYDVALSFSQSGKNIIDTKFQGTVKELEKKSDDNKKEVEVKDEKQIVPMKIEPFKFEDILEMLSDDLEGKSLSIDDLSATLLDDLTVEVAMPDLVTYLATRLKSIDARHNWAEQSVLDNYAKALNENIEMTLSMKGLNMPVPVRMQAVEYGAGKTIMPAVQLDGTENYTPIKQMLDLETLEYINYIADDNLETFIDIVKIFVVMNKRS